MHHRPARCVPALLITLLGLGACAGPSSAQPAPHEPAPARAAVADEVSQARIMADLRALPTTRSGRGGPEHDAGLRQTESLIADALRAMGYEPELQPVPWFGQRPAPGEEPRESFNNIIVNIPGTTRPDEVVLMSAHIDAVTRAPGADDDGSGTSALLEMARVLRDRPHERTIRLCFFTLEEVGLVGSTRYVETIRERLASKAERIVVMVSMDMIGFFSDEEGSQQSPIGDIKIPGFEMPTTGNFLGIATVSRHKHVCATLVELMGEASPELPIVRADFFPIAPPDFLRSDHAPFLLSGVPAMIISDTAEFRNPNYHREGDTIDTVDPHRLYLAAKAMAHATHRFAIPEGEADPLAPKDAEAAPNKPAPTN